MQIYWAPRSWAQKAYPKLVYYKKHDVGGHSPRGNSRSSFPKTFARRFERFEKTAPDT